MELGFCIFFYFQAYTSVSGIPVGSTLVTSAVESTVDMRVRMLDCPLFLTAVFDKSMSSLCHILSASAPLALDCIIGRLTWFEILFYYSSLIPLAPTRA
jgi:hypothetical protein